MDIMHFETARRYMKGFVRQSDKRWIGIREYMYMNILKDNERPSKSKNKFKFFIS